MTSAGFSSLHCIGIRVFSSNCQCFLSGFQTAVNTEQRFICSRGEITSVKPTSVALAVGFLMQLLIPSCQYLGICWNCPRQQHTLEVFMAPICWVPERIMFKSMIPQISQIPSQPANTWVSSPTSTQKMDFACQLWPKHVLCNEIITDMVFVWIKLVYSFIKQMRGKVANSDHSITPKAILRSTPVYV